MLLRIIILRLTFAISPKPGADGDETREEIQSLRYRLATKRTEMSFFKTLFFRFEKA
jgi:hypothetical protein